VLVPKGQLIDLRSISENAPIEVVASGRVLFAGRRIQSEAGIADDAAANEAMDAAVSAGLFVREYVGSFKYNSYWDTPDELEAFAAETWTMSYLPAVVLMEVRRLMANHGESARVRLHRTFGISRYRKHVEHNMRIDRALGEIA